MPVAFKLTKLQRPGKMAGSVDLASAVQGGPECESQHLQKTLACPVKEVGKRGP